MKNSLWYHQFLRRSSFKFLKIHRKTREEMTFIDLEQFMIVEPWLKTFIGHFSFHNLYVDKSNDFLFSSDFCSVNSEKHQSER